MYRIMYIKKARVETPARIYPLTQLKKTILKKQV